MADDTVQVKLGADVSDAKAGMADGSRAIAESLAKMADALQNFGSKNKSVVDDALKNNADLSRSFLELKASTTSGFNAITGVIERFRGVLGTLAAALAGGAIFKGAVDSLLAMEDAVRGLEIIFGVSAEKATQLAVQLKLAGVSAETFEQMATKAGRVLKTNSEEFTRLGVTVKDASGALLPMDTILKNVYATMQTFKAGTDQDLVALTLLGRGAKDFASDMQRLEAAEARAVEVQRSLGIEMGPDRQSQVEQYRRQVNEFGLVLETIGEKIGEAVLPRLQGLATWFAEYGPTAIGLIITAVQGFLTVLQSLGALAATVAIIVKGAFDLMVAAAETDNAVIRATFAGNWSAIPAIVAAGYEKIKAITKETADSVVKTWDDATAKVNAMWGGNKPPQGLPSAVPKSGTRSFTSKPTGGVGADDIAELENALKAEEDSYNKRMLMQGSFQTWSIAQTRDYWENVLNTQNLSVKQRMAVENKYYDAERQVQQAAFAAYLTGLEAEKAALGHNIEAKIAIEQKEYDAVAQRYGLESAQAAIAYKKLVDLRQQLADQRLKIAEIEEKAQEATYKHEIEMSKLAADQAVSMKQISAAQRLEIEKSYIQQEYQAEISGIQARIAAAAADPTSDPAKLAEMKAQLLKVEQEYQTQLTRVDNAAVLEREKYAIQAQDAITSSITDTLAALVSGTKNWKQTMLDAFKALDDQLVKIAANQIVQQFMGPGTSGGGFLSQITGAIFGGGDTAKSAVETANTTAVGLLTAAVTANTAALAASSAGGLFGGGGGGGFGFGGLFGGDGGGGLGFGFPSFDVGTPYVPQDTLAVVHRGEAIIPAARNRGSISGTGGLTVNNHFTLSGPVDSRTMDQIAANAAIGTQRAAARIL